MKTLFDSNAYAEINQRIDKLRPDSQRQWGKMDVAQMLAHCVGPMEMAIGNKKPKRQLLGQLIGWLAIKDYLSDKPFKPNLPTADGFKVADPREFDREKTKLKTLIREFHEGGEASATTHPHSFFGQLTQKQWGETQYKHIDHHLRQFGV